MLTKIEQLKQAGFSDEEIGDWANTERPRMQAAGFSDSEIDDDFGVTRPPREVPPTFIERLKQGNALQRVIGTMGEYGQAYFGDEPLGISPEHEEALNKLGIVETPDDIGPFWPIQVGNIIYPTARSIDALLRSVPAGIAALGAGAGQAFEETLGTGQQAGGKAARDFAQLAQIAALLSGVDGPRTGSVRAPVPKITNEPVIALPRAEDFRNAAASIAGNAASFPAEQKMLRLWTGHGIHPLEVADDALRDPAIAEIIKSKTDELPAVYVGHDQMPTATGAGTKAAAQIVEPGQLDEIHSPAKQPGEPKEGTSLSEPQFDNGELSTVAPAKRILPEKDTRTPGLEDADHENRIASSEESPRQPSGLPKNEITNQADSMESSDRPVFEQSALDRGVGHEGNATVPVDMENESFHDLITPENALTTADSKAIQLYNPPQIKLRPFSKDYPKRPRADAERRLLTDIEGRLLDAKFIVGRRTLGAADKALSSANIESAAKRLGVSVKIVDPVALSMINRGMYIRYISRGQPSRHIWVNRDLAASDRNLTKAHEFGHAIDDIVGYLSKDLAPNEVNELRRVYGTLRARSEALAFRRQPENARYAPDQVNAELLVEGIRAYMANPNYFKTIAPKTAAKIRAAVNDNPDIKKVIQFNSLGAAGLIGAAGTRNQDKDDQ